MSDSGRRGSGPVELPLAQRRKKMAAAGRGSSRLKVGLSTGDLHGDEAEAEAERKGEGCGGGEGAQGK